MKGPFPPGKWGSDAFTKLSDELRDGTQEVNQMQARGSLYCADTDKCFELYVGWEMEIFMSMQHRKARQFVGDPGSNHSAFNGIFSL